MNSFKQKLLKLTLKDKDEQSKNGEGNSDNLKRERGLVMQDGEDDNSFFSGNLQFVLYICLVLAGQSVSLIPFGATISAQNVIAESLGVKNDLGQTTWILAAYSITASAFVVIGGQLCDVLGAKIVWRGSMIWMFIWNLIAGFANKSAFFDACRGLAGISCGLLLPAGITLLATSFEPGKKRALIFGLFGALAPFSAAGGSVFQVMLAQLVSPSWIWWSLAIINAALFFASVLLIPTKVGKGIGGSIDYIGGFLGASGLILFNFSFSQSTVDGWQSGSVYGTLIAGLVALLAFTAWEIKFAKSPVLPFSIWKTPTFGWLLFSAFCGFLSFGVYVVYAGQLFIRTKLASPLLTQAYFIPFTLGAFVAAIAAGQFTRILPGQAIMIAGLTCLTVANTLLATCSPETTYWTHIFFSMCFVSFGPDFLFTAAQLLASNTVKKSQQGVAGGLVGTALNFGLALGAGLGGVIDDHLNKNLQDPLRGIRAAFYFGTGLGVLGIIVVVLFVRIPKDIREGYEVDTL